MKHYLLLGLAAVLFASCEKDPDLDALDTDYVVYTEFADDADFSGFGTYYLPDSILEPGSGHDVTYWEGETAKDVADVGLQMTYIAQTNQVVTGGYFYGWWDYGYWGPWWDSWYYPYPVTYTYDTGTLIIEMADLARGDGEVSGRRLPIVWYVNAQGYSFGNARADIDLLLRAVDQAFAQSPYIKTND